MMHTLALTRVNDARAISHALAQAFGDKGSGAVREFTRRELADAFLAPAGGA